MNHLQLQLLQSLSGLPVKNRRNVVDFLKRHCRDIYVVSKTEAYLVSMTFVVNSTSVNNSFISTIDHLPCDVIRSLWLVQSMNITIDKNKQKLHQLLLHLQNDPLTCDQYLPEILTCKSNIERLGQEAIQEASALNNQLITHKIGLNDELLQLKQIADVKIHKQTNLTDKQHLQKQLKQHYKKHPLQSQLDAIKDQKLNKLNEAALSKSTGLKLVLKIPSQYKSKKPSNKIKVKLNKKKVKKPVKKVVAPVAAEIVVEDNNEYCFCKQRSFGDMIACDNEESCPNGEWFHYKCVGLLNRVDALKYTTGKEKWFCSNHCREIVESKVVKTIEKKKSKRKRRW